MEKKHKTTDLTTGSPLVQILLFSLPLVLGTLFQQLYSFADTVIVGRFLGVDALAAVGTTYSLHFLTLGFVQGACVGFGIPLAQSFGAKNQKDIHRYLWNGTWLCLFLSVVLTAAMTAAAGPLLAMIHTPESIFSMAVIYIQILFLGIPASMLYNYSAGALRALGDSRHPFYFLLFASILNILLDYVFIVPLGMGVDGAALATVLSQLVSGLLNTWWLFTKIDIIRIRKDEMALSKAHLGKLCIIGLPMGFEYSVSAIGAVVMQNAINSLGSVAVAAQTAGEKIRQMFTLPMESVGMAMATYAGQNYGAGRMDRIRQGIRSGLTIQALYCVFAWTAIFLLKMPLVELVLGEAAFEAAGTAVGAGAGAIAGAAARTAAAPTAPVISPVAEGAVQYLTLISTLFIIHGSLMIFRNVLQGLGYSMHAILSGVGELIGRSMGGWLAVQFFGFTAICYANPLAWGLALLYCITMVWRFVFRRK